MYRDLFSQARGSTQEKKKNMTCWSRHAALRDLSLLSWLISYWGYAKREGMVERSDDDIQSKERRKVLESAAINEASLRGYLDLG